MEHILYNNFYNRKIDKSQIPTCNILGVKIAAIDMNWLLNFTNENIHNLAGDYICVSNVHTTITAYENMTYRNIQNNGIMAIPDGAPLSFLGQKRGFSNMKRTTGPDYMMEIFKMSAQYGYRHFFYGSTKDTLIKIKQRLSKEYPGLQIAGMYNPPYRNLTEKEDLLIVQKINDSGADFVWVGLGAPKQEIWMAKHQGIINSFMVGVGAGFDYYAGNIKRAPEWMQKQNLEWLFRLCQDPKRLFKRYLYSNIKFVWNAVIKGS